MKGKNWLFLTENKMGHNLNKHKKSCRRFAEKNSWEGTFMCGQASLEWIMFTVEKSEFGFLSIKMAKCTFGLLFLKTMKIYLFKVFCLDCKVLYLTKLTVLHVSSIWS